jgi:hypothetical protein
MYLKVIGLDAVGWIHLAQGRYRWRALGEHIKLTTGHKINFVVSKLCNLDYCSNNLLSTYLIHTGMYRIKF